MYRVRRVQEIILAWLSLNVNNLATSYLSS